MELLWELFETLLAAFGLTCLVWLVYGRLVLPVGAGDTRTQAVVCAGGAGAGLEQTVAALRWLRRTGLWRGRIVIRDCGLDPSGRAAAMALAMEPGVELDRTGGAEVP